MKTIKVVMRHKKETKTTHVYSADDYMNAEVTTVYIRKTGLPKEPPADITLTVEEIS